MIRTLINKLITFFKKPFGKKKTEAIPFAEQSRRAVARKKETAEKEKFRPKKGKPRKKREAPQKTREEVKTLKRNKKQPPVKKPPAKPKKKQKAWDVAEFDVPPQEGKVRFHDLNLHTKLMHAIFDLDFKYCTPIQAGILPETLNGSDALGKAQTGTGKSAAFLITIISHLLKHPVKGGPKKGFPRALILAPTRELALQIEKDAVALCKYTPFRILALFGGTDYEKQKKTLQSNSVDIIVATPGRLIDFKNQKAVNLSKVEILVIDEADRMLDMGFIPDIRNIVYSTPDKKERRTMFYSATYTPEVTRLAAQWTNDPCRVEIEPDKVESESVKQFIYLVTSDEKFILLYNLLKIHNLDRVLVFTNRRDQARDLSAKLSSLKIQNALLSGEVHQNKRIRALESFRSGKIRVLVATDVAARGLHIDNISHVINYNLPQDAEHYVHRIGRTGRAGASGISVSFASEDDSFYIPAIEDFLGHKMECEYPEDELLAPISDAEEKAAAKRQKPKKESRKPEKKPGEKKFSGPKKAQAPSYQKRKPQNPRYRKRPARAPKS